MPGPITNFYLANGAKLSEVLNLLHKMETRIWNKTRIWNTFADDQEVFHIRVHTVTIFSDQKHCNADEELQLCHRLKNKTYAIIM